MSDETFQENADGTETFSQVSEFVLEGGSAFLYITGTSRLQVDERTCVGSIDGTLEWSLLPDRSTGEFALVTADGGGTFMDRFVVPRDSGGCVHEPTGPNVFLARLHGTATAPVSASG